ncbi:hypothetical protein [Bacillus cereus]|uniref:hypothetical protein n=1 Tax=Bacillus cereus TaxID=1396 RepID=UPI0020D2847E|nr:hypothetical protein [Bacillus cereus]
MMAHDGAKKNKKAVGNYVVFAPFPNGTATTDGLYRKYLSQELYDLKEEQEETINNDTLSILWESIMLQHVQIIHVQRIMFVKGNQDMTQELRNN